MPDELPRFANFYIIRQLQLILLPLATTLIIFLYKHIYISVLYLLLYWMPSDFSGEKKKVNLGRPIRVVCRVDTCSSESLLAIYSNRQQQQLAIVVRNL